MARAPASDVPGAVEAVSVIESTIEGRYQVVTRVAS
jgi:hypothetical protein